MRLPCFIAERFLELRDQPYFVAEANVLWDPKALLFSSEVVMHLEKLTHKLHCITMHLDQGPRSNF